MPLFIKPKVTFTGTQMGLTNSQRKALVHLFRELRPVEFRHGDCIGADSEAHDILRAILPECQIIIHPPSDNSKRAFKNGDNELAPEPYLIRNHAMVDKCSQLIATPKSKSEELRSGTWATIRYARKVAREIYIINPNGIVITEQG